VKSILVISNLYAPIELGGYEILASQICEDLVARGHRVVMLTSVGDERVHRGVEVWPRLELTRGFDRPDDRSSSRRWRVHRKNRRVTAEALEEMQADATLCLSLRRLTLGPATAIEASTVPRLYVVNDAWPLAYRPRPHSERARSKVGGWIDRSFLSSMTTIGASLSPALVLSQSLKDELRGAGVSTESAAVVHQGVATEVFRPAQPRSLSKHVRLLYAGQLHGYKGVHHVLTAIGKLESRLPEGTITLTIAGKGDAEYTEKLKRKAARLRTIIDFVGHIPFSAMPDLYRKHDVLVFPSTWNEPLGLSHLEAMATGVPAVVAAAGGCRELIERCRHIFPFAAGDTDELSEVLFALIRSRRRRRLAGEASRKWVTQNASLHAYVDRIERELHCDIESAAMAPMTPI
jgi:glycosyltransferase involved in cell wall biosynthesis